MKAILYCTVLLFSGYFAQSQTYNSTCVPLGNMEAIYRNDAYRLAIKRVNEVNSPWKDSVQVPEIVIDSIAKALYAMHNMDVNLLKDTIITKFGFSFFHNYSYEADSCHVPGVGNSFDNFFSAKAIRITVFNNSPWVADWLAGNFNNTVNDTVNSLTNRFGLHVALNSWQVYPDKTIYHITSPVAINTLALVQQFEQLDAVEYAVVEYYSGGGNSMKADFLNGKILLTYTLGCGDCPSGCTFGRTWKFEVNTGSDCSVNFVSANYWGLIELLPMLYDFSLCVGPVTPVTLTNISVIQKNNYQLVEWQMAAEDDVAKYIIERSPDGVNYKPIGETNPLVTAGLNNYTWKDVDQLNGKYFYRIRIVEKSGTFKYSPVVSLMIKANAGITVQPTLIRNGLINIQFNKVVKGNYTVDLLNATGQKLFSENVEASAETFNKSIVVPANIPTGTYVVSVYGKSTQANQFIFIAR